MRLSISLFLYLASFAFWPTPALCQTDGVVATEYSRIVTMINFSQEQLEEHKRTVANDFEGIWITTDGRASLTISSSGHRLGTYVFDREWVLNRTGNQLTAQRKFTMQEVMSNFGGRVSAVAARQVVGQLGQYLILSLSEDKQRLFLVLETDTFRERLRNGKPTGEVRIDPRNPAVRQEASFIRYHAHKIDQTPARTKPSCAQKAQIQQQVRDLQARIERDKNAIRSLGLGKIADGVEEWQNVAEDARAKFMSQAFDMLLANAQAAVKAGGSLNPPSANSAISKLRGVHIDIDPLNAAIRKLAATPGKPPRAKDVEAFLDGLGKAKDLVSLSQTGSDVESRLEALSTVLGWFQTSPTLAYLAADLNFTASSVYNNLARRESKAQIDQLTKLSETNLKSLKTLSNRIGADVRELKSAKEVLATLSSCP